MKLATSDLPDHKGGTMGHGKRMVIVLVEQLSPKIGFRFQRDLRLVQAALLSKWLPIQRQRRGVCVAARVAILSTGQLPGGVQLRRRFRLSVPLQLPERHLLSPSEYGAPPSVAYHPHHTERDSTCATSGTLPAASEPRAWTARGQTRAPW